jgi:putative aminopeptidase FrvX
MNTKINLQKLLAVQSYTGADYMMRKHIMDIVTKMDVYVELDNHNIYITKGDGPIYPCVVAHLDTVHQILPSYKVRKIGDVWYAFSGDKQVGVGGDDKCGIYVALRMLERYDNIKVAFFHDEEIGCVGSGMADMTFFSDVSFAMQADRRGASDIIFDAAGNKLASNEFIRKLKPLTDRFGFFPNFGSITDVQELKSRGLNISCFNISAGYYDPHTAKETVNELDLMNTYKFMCAATDLLGHERQVHYVAPKRYKGGSIYDRDDWYNDNNLGTAYHIKSVDKTEETKSVFEDTTDNDIKYYFYNEATSDVELFNSQDEIVEVYNLSDAEELDMFMVDYPEYYDLINQGICHNFFIS